MAVARVALISTGVVAIAVAGYWMLRRHRQRHGAQKPGDSENGTKSTPNRPTLYVFHCGEQPLMVDSFCTEARVQGFDVKVDTLDRYEAWGT
jgi:hypothetical protein